MTECGCNRNYSNAVIVETGIQSSRSAVFKVIHAFKAGLAIATCLFASLAVAQSTNSFPQMPVDAKTVRVQKQAEEVYERTDYERAFFIYSRELAPIGDKYGQYMVGFMYLTGKGVEEDLEHAAGAGQDQKIPAGRGNGLALGVVEGIEDMGNVVHRRILAKRQTFYGGG